MKLKSGIRKPSQNSGERAYAYAKAMGIIRKTFIGNRISELTRANSLMDLDKMLFPVRTYGLQEQDSPHDKDLLLGLERRITKRTIQNILSVINSFSRPPQILIHQLRSYEYADLKNCLNYLSVGKTSPPLITNIGPFRTIRFDLYPDIKKMLAGTEFEFLLEKNAVESAEAELDLLYYQLLLKSLNKLSAFDRINIGKIIAEEISLRNCVFALRMRTYFNKTPAEILSLLLKLEMTVDNMTIDLSGEALKILEIPLDSYDNWKGWRWKKLINLDYDGKEWKMDPRHFQNAASHYIYRMSYRYFRRTPLSICSAFCYIKLNQFEQDLLISIAEGFGLGMTGKDVFDLLNILPPQEALFQGGMP